MTVSIKKRLCCNKKKRGAVLKLCSEKCTYRYKCMHLKKMKNYSIFKSVECYFLKTTGALNGVPKTVVVPH